jgi:L-asparaginase/Glu-tRNA(Gln) amidotransferase subunit D
VAADDLQPWKARILVRLALAAGRTDTGAIQPLFDEG